MAHQSDSQTRDGSIAGRVRKEFERRYRRYIVGKEDRLASAATDRVVRPFDWGLEWTRNWPCASQSDSDTSSPASRLRHLNQEALRNRAAFFDYRSPTDYRLDGDRLRFTSAVTTPHEANNSVYAQWFPSPRARGRAVLLLPHWNAKAEQHVSLCRAISALGISALRLSLPYHDLRMPVELSRADYAVSANVARTVDATRQAVIDSRSCLDWLEAQGYSRLGIVGTSLGSCYAFITSAHDKRLRANVYNLFALYFADVVWTGLTTRHIRQGLEGKIELGQLRDAWEVINPCSYLDRYATFDKKSLFIYGSCDTTFLPEYSETMIEMAKQRNIPHKLVVFPCGHYTLGRFPFNLMDGFQICSFLLRSL